MDNRGLQTNGSHRSASSDLLSDFIFADLVRDRSLPASLPVGVPKGEGIGPDVICATLRVLRALENIGRHSFEVNLRGPIGAEAESRYGEPLSGEVVEFCRNVSPEGEPFWPAPEVAALFTIYAHGSSSFAS